MTEKSPSIFHSIPWLLGWASFSVMGPYVMMKLIYNTLQVIFSHFFDEEDKLQGKIVLITGASSGLGKALAHSLYKRGCCLILASRNVDALEELKSQLIQEYTPPELHIPVALHLDLEDLNSIPSLVDLVLKKFGHVDILINNAGISYRGEIVSTDISVDLKVMLVNYFGQIALTKGFLKSMISRDSGHIVGISSIQGKIAIPFRSSYCSSKHAFQAFLDSLRAEVSNTKIRVTTVSPGYIQTNLSNNALHGDTGAGAFEMKNKKEMSAEEAAERISRSLISKESEILLCPLMYRLVVYFRNFCPSLYFYALSVKSKLMRKEETEPKKLK